jgi:polar amino acid transport system substrate-binding protein
MNYRFKSLFFTFVSIASTVIWQDFTQAGTLTEVQQRRKLVIAVKDNLAPLGFRDRSGNLQGLEIDIARKLAAEIFGKTDAIELIPITNQDRLKVVIDGTVDIVIAKVTITPTRSRVVDFSRYYYLDGTGILTSQPKIVKTRDLVGKKVAVLNNSSTIAALQYMIPQAQLVGVDSYQQAQQLLATEKVMAIAADRSLLIGWAQTNPNYHLLPDKLSTEALGIVIPKGIKYQTLRDLVDRSINRWQASGWLQQRIEYWGLK